MTSWRRVAALSELPDGAAYPITLDDTRLALYRIDGAVHAVDDVCTHEYVRLSDGTLTGRVIECPLHRARFDVVSGRCLARPAERDLETYAVRVDGDAVFVSLDRIDARGR
jgi:nitrite reductase/ring-hydroxylating ferredoxin subunit